MTTFLMRHGETEWNRARRYQGWSDSPLTPRGLAQAEALGHRLGTIPEAADADIVASPLGRARQTAEIIAGCLHRTVPPRLDERLREISLGSWDGLQRVEIEARMGDAFEEWEWYFRTPNGESYETFAGRVGDWLGEHDGRPLIVVTHGIAMRVMRGLYAGLPRSAALRLPVPQDCIFKLVGSTIIELAV